MILIDTREKGNVPELLAEKNEHEFRALHAGDYWIATESDPIVIERSTYSDFVGKIMSGRLWEQLEKCKSVSSRIYFIFEGGSLYQCNMNVKSIIGAMLSITAKGAFVIQTKGMAETIHAITYLHEKFGGGKVPTHYHSRIKPKHANEKEQTLMALQGYAKIGSKTAGDLLDKFGSLVKVLEASEEELAEVLGPSKAKIVNKAFKFSI